MKTVNLTPVDKLHIELFEEKVGVIERCVRQFYGRTHEQVTDRDRRRVNMIARQMIHLLCREQFGSSCPFSIIGYLTGAPDHPYDHNAVRNSCNKLRTLLNEKSVMGRWMHVDIRNEYQIIRGNVIYELSRMDKKEPEVANERLSMWIGTELHDRLNKHCDTTGITKSLFAKTAILNELNNLQNGVCLQQYVR